MFVRIIKESLIRYGSTCSSSIVSAAQPHTAADKTVQTTGPADWSSFESGIHFFNFEFHSIPLKIESTFFCQQLPY